MRPFRLLAACGVLALAAACLNERAADHRHPKYSHEVVLEAGHPSMAIGIELNAALRLSLPGPSAGTDFVWEIVSNNTLVLEQTTELRANTVAFYSLKPGRSILRFVLVRPGARDAVPAAHFEVLVVVRDADGG